MIVRPPRYGASMAKAATQTKSSHRCQACGHVEPKWLGRCPACAKGNLFRSFLKVAPQCECCGQELFHHQADDFPAYLVIMVVGHLIAGAILWVEAAQLMSAWAELAASVA